MAELVLYVSADTTIPSTRFQDGDVIHAFTQRRVWATHAQHYCHRKLAGFNADGLRPAGSLSETWYALTHEFKFVRVGASVERHNLRTLAVDVLGLTPNASGEAIDVEAFVRRRKLHANHALFGMAGAEVWYGGQTLQTSAIVSAIWDAIEARTANLRSNHLWWPLTLVERMHFLALPIDDTTDELTESWEARVVDDTDPANSVLIKKRAHFTPWRDTVTNTPLRNRILDPTREVDLRGTLSPLNPNLLIRLKA